MTDDVIFYRLRSVAVYMLAMDFVFRFGPMVGFITLCFARLFDQYLDILAGVDE